MTPATANPNPGLPQNWLNLTTSNGSLDNRLANPPSPYFSFYTPLSLPPAQQCGQRR